MDTPSPNSPNPSPAPFFSVVVPCCDVADYLDECIASLLEQPFADWECLLVVEDSADATLDIARRHAAADPRFRLLTGPRTGSCSTPRNRGVEAARGEYALFLDGDDKLVPGTLLRLHKMISARPGADIYPCGMKMQNDMPGFDDDERDNYPPDAPAELTGPEAVLLTWRYKGANLKPQVQLSIYRLAFLREHSLGCLPGVRSQDHEFTPRALYAARRVVPLHERYYIYRRRPLSVCTRNIPHAERCVDWACIFRSLFAFHARVSREPGFDRRLSECWRQQWLPRMFGSWFYPSRIRTIPRASRVETLEILFRDGFSGLEALAAGSSPAKRAACRWVERFVRHPALRPAAEAFFRVYFALAEARRR